METAGEGAVEGGCARLAPGEPCVHTARAPNRSQSRASSHSYRTSTLPQLKLAAHLLAAGVAGAAHAVVSGGGARPGGECLGPVDLAGARQHGIAEGGDQLQLVGLGEGGRRGGGEQQAEGGGGGDGRCCPRWRHGARREVLLGGREGPAGLLRSGAGACVKLAAARA